MPNFTTSLEKKILKNKKPPDCPHHGMRRVFARENTTPCDKVRCPLCGCCRVCHSTQEEWDTGTGPEHGKVMCHGGKFSPGSGKFP